MVLCECGCGKEVKLNNRFVNGHNRKGKRKENDESVMRQAKKLTGRTKENDEGVRKGAEKRKGRTKETHEGVRRRAEKMKGRTKENHEGVRRMAEKLTGRTKEEYEYLEIGAKKRRGRTKENDEGVRRGAEKRRGRTKETHEDIRRRAEKITGRKPSKESRVKRSESMKKYYQLYPEVLIAKSEFMKKNNPMNNPYLIRKIIASWNIKPNKPEKIINRLLQYILPNEYALNVTGHIVIDSKIPDFVNINGQKKLIELYGDYWHRNDNPQDRINLFKHYGWDTLIIWEHELIDMKEVTNKILEFHGLSSLPSNKQLTLELKNG